MKYLATDLGNVIIEVNFIDFSQELAKTLNLSTEEINYFLHRTTKTHDLGLTSIADELHDHFKIHSDIIINGLIKSWNNVIKPNKNMNDFLMRLIKNGVKVAILSNIGIEHESLLRNMLTPEIFDQSIQFCSCKVGARKPTYIYYKTFLDMHPEFSGSVYLDDKIENIQSSTKFGFNSVHFVLDSFKSDYERDHKVNDIYKLIGV